MANTIGTNLQIPAPMIDELNVWFAKIFDFTYQGLARRKTAGEGETVIIRGFNELSGDADDIDDGYTGNSNNITTNKEIAPILHKNKIFGSEDLAEIISGMKAFDEIRNQIARFYNKEVQNRFLDVLKALFDASSGILATSNRYDVYADNSSAGSQKYPTPQNCAIAMQKIGDNMFDLGVWMVHSATYAYWLSSGFVDTVPLNDAYAIDGAGVLKSFMGKPILVCDSAFTAAGTSVTRYRSILAAPGMLDLGIQKDMNPEIFRFKNKVTEISTDMHFYATVRGIAWAGPNRPNNTQLATAANWTLAYPLAKQVRVVAIDHNIPA